MKIKLTLLLCLCASSIELYAQKQVFRISDLDNLLKKHKTVAILPIKTSVSFKKIPKGFDAESNKANEKETGINLQQGMYTYLLRRHDDYFVSFQDADKTNVLLTQAGVIDKLDEVLPDSLTKILGVDAIIKCSYSYEKTGSEAGAIAKMLIFGYGGKIGSGSLTMQIYDGSGGVLLWRFYKEMNEGVFASGDKLMERMMRKVSRNFPYFK
jgi:hypothetical protein